MPSESPSKTFFKPVNPNKNPYFKHNMGCIELWGKLMSQSPLLTMNASICYIMGYYLTKWSNNPKVVPNQVIFIFCHFGYISKVNKN